MCSTTRVVIYRNNEEIIEHLDLTFYYFDGIMWIRILIARKHQSLYIIYMNGYERR